MSCCANAFVYIKFTSNLIFFFFKCLSLFYMCTMCSEQHSNIRTMELQGFPVCTQGSGSLFGKKSYPDTNISYKSLIYIDIFRLFYPNPVFFRWQDLQRSDPVPSFNKGLIRMVDYTKNSNPYLKQDDPVVNFGKPLCNHKFK